MRSRLPAGMLLAALLALPLAGVASAPAGAADPVTVSAVPGNGQATVSWTIATKPAIRYVVVEGWINGRKMGRQLGVDPKLRTKVFPKLQNGVKYVFAVRVEYKSSNNWFRYFSPGTRVGVPLQPTNAHASKVAADGAGTLRVSVTAPATNGSPITAYNATCSSSNGGATKTGVSSGPAVPVVKVAGLTTGASYRCAVSAKNARGSGKGSAPSNAIVV